MLFSSQAITNVKQVAHYLLSRAMYVCLLDPERSRWSLRSQCPYYNFFTAFETREKWFKTYYDADFIWYGFPSFAAALIETFSTSIAPSSSAPLLHETPHDTGFYIACYSFCCNFCCTSCYTFDHWTSNTTNSHFSSLIKTFAHSET